MKIAGLFLVVALIGSQAMAQVSVRNVENGADATQFPWREYIYASGTGSDEWSARNFADMDFDSQALTIESRCRSQGGDSSTMITSPALCMETAGLYRCTQQGTVDCRFP